MVPSQPESLRWSKKKKKKILQICYACCIIPKKTWGCNCGQSALIINLLINTFWVKSIWRQCFLLIHLQSCEKSIFALSLWWEGCRSYVDVMWGKSHLKQFNIITQHNKIWKKWRGMKTLYKHCTYMKYNSHRSHFQTKQVSGGQRSMTNFGKSEQRNISPLCEIYNCADSYWYDCMLFFISFFTLNRCF